MPGGILFSDYDPNFYPSAFAKDHWLFNPVWRLRRAISYRVMKVGEQVDLETARLADYYSETIPGLEDSRIRQALQNMPEFAELSRNIVIEPTKDGVDVSLVDQDGRSMFPEGSVDPYERTRLVLEALAPTLRRLPNRLSVTGHTASLRPGSVRAVNSWSLTSGRALAVREILSAAGFPNDRFFAVVGRADTEPVFPDNPYLSPNRRVTIKLLNEEPPLPPGLFR